MPELPEVETVKRALKKTFLSKNIKKINIRRRDFRVKTPKNAKEMLLDAKIINIYRRAKYIIFDLDNKNSIILHLGMSGRVSIVEALPKKLLKHDHIILTANNGFSFIYNDARRFGGFDVCKTKEIKTHKLLNQLGIEPLSQEFNLDVFYEILQKRKTVIKNILLNQKIVCGIGNIYACEALFYAKISPLRKSNEISKKEAKKLIEEIKRILKEAIESGGTTLKDHVQPDGKLGYFVQKLAVYGKQGKACPNCSCNLANGGIKKIEQSGRSSFYCEKKQV